MGLDLTNPIERADAVNRAADVFNMCVEKAKRILEQNQIVAPSGDSIVAAATAMLNFVASEAHGDKVSEIASIAASIDAKEIA